MNANKIKIMAGVAIAILTMLVISLETIGVFASMLYIAAVLGCLLIIGVDFEITEEKPLDWEKD